MERRLATKSARSIYRQRASTVEPVFGQIKGARGIDRFRRRGLDAARHEWKLAATTHNILKMWRAGAALTSPGPAATPSTVHTGNISGDNRRIAPCSRSPRRPKPNRLGARRFGAGRRDPVDLGYVGRALAWGSVAWAAGAAGSGGVPRPGLGGRAGARPPAGASAGVRRPGRPAQPTRLGVSAGGSAASAGGRGRRGGCLGLGRGRCFGRGFGGLGGCRRGRFRGCLGRGFGGLGGGRSRLGGCLGRGSAAVGAGAAGSAGASAGSAAAWVGAGATGSVVPRPAVRLPRWRVPSPRPPGGRDRDRGCGACGRRPCGSARPGPRCPRGPCRGPHLGPPRLTPAPLTLCRRPRPCGPGGGGPGCGRRARRRDRARCRRCGRSRAGARPAGRSWPGGRG